MDNIKKNYTLSLLMSLIILIGLGVLWIVAALSILMIKEEPMLLVDLPKPENANQYTNVLKVITSLVGIIKYAVIIGFGVTSFVFVKERKVTKAEFLLRFFKYCSIIFMLLYIVEIALSTKCMLDS